MELDEAFCRGAVRSRDSRFDGFFITAVLSTGIYCRPSCPARTPKDANMRFYRSAAAAQSAGFRACKRCRPDAMPGSPEWSARADTVARAMRLIADGLVDRAGVPELAKEVGYSTRQLERLLSDELGAGPLALAQAQRAQTARTLIESTELPMSDIAFAAGFSSIRTFNDVIGATYAMTPTQLRVGGAPSGGQPGLISLRLPFRQPLEPSNLFGHLIATAVPGIEEFRDGAYRATVRLPRGHAIVTAHPPTSSWVPISLRLSDVRDLGAAVTRCRRLLDLDADPCAIDEALSADATLRPLIDRARGRRVPHTLEPDQFALRAVLGQQVSTSAARTHAGRIVTVLGDRVDDPDGGLTHVFPTAHVLVEAQDELPELLRMPESRQRTFIALARALADREVLLDAGADWSAARGALARIPGIGPWTIESIAMRSLGDPDAFLATDLGVRKATQALGLPIGAAALTRASTRWSPWRSYAVQYLWASSPHAINTIPDFTEIESKETPR